MKKNKSHKSFLIASNLHEEYFIYFMKSFLTSVCLLVISCLIVSVVSPELHSSLFHGGGECSHGDNGKSCSSHKKESSEDDRGLCAVVLFGESSEHFFTLSTSLSAVLLESGVSNLDSKKIFSAKGVNDHWARGPPELV